MFANQSVDEGQGFCCRRRTRPKSGICVRIDRSNERANDGWMVGCMILPQGDPSELGLRSVAVSHTAKRVSSAVAVRVSCSYLGRFVQDITSGLQSKVKDSNVQVQMKECAKQNSWRSGYHKASVEPSRPELPPTAFRFFFVKSISGFNRRTGRNDRFAEHVTN